MIRTRHLLLKLFLAALVPAALVLIYLDAKITSTFTDKMWELPAKVYARPLELFAGARLKAEDLAYELEVLGYRSVANPGGPGQFARNRDRFEIYTRGFDFPGESELTEADTTHFELPEIPTRATAPAAPRVGLNRETRFLERFCDERSLGHGFS